MADGTIEVIENGPFIVTGEVSLKDHGGNSYPTRKRVALCRCGASTSKPFCDGTHSKIGFQAPEKATANSGQFEAQAPDEGESDTNDSERRSSSQEAFLIALSHQLRTPLTPVLMTAAALREDERIPEDAREQLAMIERNIVFEARLIDELLDLPPGAAGQSLANSQPAAPVSAASASTTSLAPASLRLLLVEDHESTMQVLSRLLKRAGHQVVCAGTLSEALRAAGRNEFDVVISDLGLPDGTGHELMEILRARHGLRGIALSGYGMLDDIMRARKAGFATHLTKPVDFPQLQRALVETMERKPI